MASHSDDSKGVLIADPDLDEAAALMNESWRRPCWRYSEALLADYLRRPCGGRALSVAWRSGERMLGFFAGVPIEVDGQIGRHRAIFTSFLTVHPQARDPVLPARLFASVLAAARAAGASHLYTVFHHDAATNRFVRRLFHLGGCAAHDLLEFTFLTRPIGVRARAPAQPSGHVVEYAAAHEAQVAALLATSTQRVALRQRVPPGDVGAICAHELAIARLFVRDGLVVGFAAGRLRDVLHHQTMRHLHLDFLALEGLGPAEQDELLASVVESAQAAGVHAIVTPELACADARPLLSNGFVRFPGKAVLAVAGLTPDAAPVARVASAFFEVY